MQYRSKVHEDKNANYHTPEPKYDLMDQNYFKNALVAMNNLVARANTKWTLEETKLFLCALSKVKTRDQDNWVMMPKRDILKTLGIDATNASKLRQKFANVVKKSYLQIDGPTEEEWFDGVLLTSVKSTKKEIGVKFNDEYLPLLDQLDTHFTEFYLDQITSLTHKASYNLYVYLVSWYNKAYQKNIVQIPKKNLDKIFNLKPGQYWRDYDDPDKRKFDWHLFEKYALIPAVAEINGRVTCDLEIHQFNKVKDGKFVLGYEFEYDFHDELDIIQDPRHQDSKKVSLIPPHEVIEEVTSK